MDGTPRKSCLICSQICLIRIGDSPTPSSQGCTPIVLYLQTNSSREASALQVTDPLPKGATEFAYRLGVYK
jgi:hypothetical protein